MFDTGSSTSQCSTPLSRRTHDNEVESKMLVSKWCMDHLLHYAKIDIFRTYSIPYNATYDVTQW